MHARKSLLFENEHVYTKKCDGLFDVTMGSYDGAEVTDLVGLFLMRDLESLLGKGSVGLYRDDGLANLTSVSGPQADRIRKQLIKCFKDHGLGITVDTNLQVTEFLDVVLDLRNGKYYPYRKPNDPPLYIHAESNHPPSITKQLPMMISRRISDISCNEEEFDKAKRDYNEALSKSGYRDRIKYDQYRSLFNKNNVKVSYSCVESMGSVIQSHNRKILNQQKPKEEKPCNCRIKGSCPLDGSCRKTCIVYKAAVTSEASTKFYYGASEGEFKQRYYNHTKSFLHSEYRTETELSEHIWNLKNQNKRFEIAWSIAALSSPYRAGTRRCDLCLTEKLIIAKADPNSLLNSRAELVSKCRHANKFSLKKL